MKENPKDTMDLQILGGQT